MKKIVGQGFLLILLFLGVWFGLASIHWIDVCEKTTLFKKVPDKLGTLYWDYFKGENVECLDTTITMPIDSLVRHICVSNNLERDIIKLHIVSNGDVNAFALPDGHLVIYSGLLNTLDNASQLCGVLCHEIAHIEGNHVIKKLAKEIGLISLLSNVTGSYNNQFLYESLRVLTSTAYDRSQEDQADQMAVMYMMHSGLDPLGFAEALEIISRIDVDNSNKFNWLSTHPDTKRRIRTIQALRKSDSIYTTTIISVSSWDKMKNTMPTD